MLFYSNSKETFSFSIQGFAGAGLTNPSGAKLSLSQCRYIKWMRMSDEKNAPASQREHLLFKYKFGFYQMFKFFTEVESLEYEKPYGDDHPNFY